MGLELSWSCLGILGSSLLIAPILSYHITSIFSGNINNEKKLLGFVLFSCDFLEVLYFSRSGLVFFYMFLFLLCYELIGQRSS